MWCGSRSNVLLHLAVAPHLSRECSFHVLVLVCLQAHVKEKVITIPCSQGTQTLKWLGHVAIARYDEKDTKGWLELGMFPVQTRHTCLPMTVACVFNLACRNRCTHCRIEGWGIAAFGRTGQGSPWRWRPRGCEALPVYVVLAVGLGLVVSFVGATLQQTTSTRSRTQVKIPSNGVAVELNELPIAKDCMTQQVVHTQYIGRRSNVALSLFPASP